MDRKSTPSQEALLDRFEEHLLLSQGRSENTARAYLADLRSFGRHVASLGRSLMTFEDVDLARYFEEKKRVSPRTRSRILSSLRTWSRFLEMERLRTEPLPQMESPRIPKSLPKVLTQEDVTRLILTPDQQKPEGIRDRALLAFFLFFGPAGL